MAVPDEALGAGKAGLHPTEPGKRAELCRAPISHLNRAWMQVVRRPWPWRLRHFIPSRLVYGLRSSLRTKNLPGSRSRAQNIPTDPAKVVGALHGHRWQCRSQHSSLATGVFTMLPSAAEGIWPKNCPWGRFW